MNKILDFSTQIKAIIDEHAYKILIGLLLIAFSLGLVIILIMNQNSNDTNNVATDYSEQSSVITSSTSSQSQNSSFAQDLYIDVKGEVKHPGVYQIPSNSRITDVIKKAGGFRSDADQQNVNLAKVLKDQDVVIVNKKVTNGNSSFNSPNSTTSNSDNNIKINLNTADLNELQRLDRVGEKKAQKIIDYRNQHNGFHSIDEIKHISGFGDKTFERLKDSLEV
ncbi:helix-hairpin-helix domain-containing protein [Apilactobacillus kunkeei]|uniref:helix-hairpin-helix domain-containing protein n=1 Tax=Apilactobacillus kunkeei TaxID=148814 RepID=UPI004034E7AE